MSSVVQLDRATLHLGDCLEVMQHLDPESVDSIVTDPPYGICFMGKEWDGKDIEETMRRKTRKETIRPDGWKRHDGAAFAAGTYDLSPRGNRAFQQWTEEWAAYALSLLKPRGHLLSFASPRTYHRMAARIEDAGFEIRDQIMWVFGSGFPKSLNLGGEWEGWGTALKPAHEPIVVARKPLVGTVAENVLGHGTGAMNIDGCRIGVGMGGGREGEETAGRRYSDRGTTSFTLTPGPRGGDARGRWPANVIHDGSEEVLAAFPEAPGQSGAVTGLEPSSKSNNVYGQFDGRPATLPRGDTGSATRFFYCAKASRTDRDEGCQAFAKKPLNWSSGDQNPGSFQSPGTEKAARNHYPTVKPTDLMRYLCASLRLPVGSSSTRSWAAAPLAKQPFVRGLSLSASSVSRNTSRSPRRGSSQAMSSRR